MPTSLKQGKDIITNWVFRQDDIKSFVDVGIGNGTYLHLIGEYQYKWTGIEIYEEYIKRFELDRRYHKIIQGDARDIELPEGDCVILGNVLEYMGKIEARKLFKKIDKKYKHVIVSILFDYAEPQRGGNNPFNNQLAVWSKAELLKLIPATYEVKEFRSPVAVFIK